MISLAILGLRYSYKNIIIIINPQFHVKIKVVDFGVKREMQIDSVYKSTVVQSDDFQYPHLLFIQTVLNLYVYTIKTGMLMIKMFSNELNKFESIR